jgi:alpha-1,6-mannosyltransferase
MVIMSLRLFRESVERKFGVQVAAWSTVIAVSQFHFLYYASRTLPNVFALVLVLVALHHWLDENDVGFLVSSGAAIVLFRAELAVLLGLYLLDSLFRKIFEVRK